MKRVLLLLCCVLNAFPLKANDVAKRPRIVAIESVTVWVSDITESNKFYSTVLGTARDCAKCQWDKSLAFDLPSIQTIWIERRPFEARDNSINRIVFRTDDLKALNNYLRASKVRLIAFQSGPNGVIRVNDPEGHQLVFIQQPPSGIAKTIQNRPISNQTRLIHAGWIVKDRAAMDKFYRDILGFHLYWQGGMKDGEPNWVSMQVPDGTDWIEYMLNVDPNANKHLRGVMNHIALGVPSVKEAAIQLEKNGVKLTEQPKIGRDGKWQLNLYDPDDTRVELMEFTPVEKPCCSEFTGTHPKP